MPRGIPNKIVTAQAIQDTSYAPSLSADMTIDSMKSTGIPLKAAIFHDTVRFGVKGTPEFAFYAPSEKSKPSRTAEMWYTPHGLLATQNGLTKLIPLANVKDTDVA